MSGRIAESQWKKEMEEEEDDLKILRKIKEQYEKKGKKNKDVAKKM